jgi:hypothetical protein
VQPYRLPFVPYDLAYQLELKVTFKIKIKYMKEGRRILISFFENKLNINQTSSSNERKTLKEGKQTFLSKRAKVIVDF